MEIKKSEQVVYKKAQRVSYNGSGTKTVETYITNELEKDYDLKGCLTLGMAVLESCFQDTRALKESLTGRYKYEDQARINRAFADKPKTIHMICDCTDSVDANKIIKWIKEANPCHMSESKRPKMAFYRK